MSWRNEILRRLDPTGRPRLDDRSTPVEQKLRLLRATNSDTVVATTVTQDLTVPENEVWDIRNIVCIGQPGLAQTLTGLRVFALASELTAAFFLKRLTRDNGGEALALAANEIASFSYRVHEQMFPPGHTLRVEGIFSAAVAANFVSIDVVGYILTPEFWPIKQF